MIKARVSRRGRRLRVAAGMTALALMVAGFALACTACESASRPAPASSPSQLVAYATQNPGDMTPVIAVVGVDGSNPRRLVPGDQPSWSPNGSQLAFMRATEDGTGIWVMDADGTNPTRLTLNPRGLDENPSWSRDGSVIVFSRSTGFAEPRQIYVVDSDGGDVRRLTSGHADSFEPAWSPDGTLIAYVRFPMHRPGQPLTAAEDTSQIWLMSADGAYPRRLTSLRQGAWRPAWSPDGSRLAFDDDDEIYLVARDGSDLRKLGPRARGFDPAWSPDGTRIAFTGGSDAHHDIYLMDLNGESSTQLTHSPANDSSPAWGPTPTRATSTSSGLP